MITTTETRDKIREYIIESTFGDTEDIQDNTLIFEAGLLDSMGLLFLIEYIKEEFSIETNDAELVVDNFKSIDSISDFIESKVGKE
ncbi:acyl carrier protein [Maribacter sp.]|uniref:acyl carrier protein n=1 Tax=Maribacter sp. TaxID=1897614 RepID=UPI0025C39B9D|nr:acyl carrier protein [Maribacter sp.]